MNWKEQLKEILKMLIALIYKLLKLIFKIFDIGGSNNKDDFNWINNNLLDFRPDAYGYPKIDVHAVNSRILSVLDKHLEAPAYEFCNWDEAGAFFFVYSFLHVKDDRYLDFNLLSNLLTREIINSYVKNIDFDAPDQLNYYLICDAVTESEAKKIRVVFYAKPGAEKTIEKIKDIIG